ATYGRVCQARAQAASCGGRIQPNHVAGKRSYIIVIRCDPRKRQSASRTGRSLPQLGECVVITVSGVERGRTRVLLPSFKVMQREGKTSGDRCASAVDISQIDCYVLNDKSPINRVGVSR